MIYKENDKVWIENIQFITDAELVREPQIVESITLAPVIDDKGEMNHVQVIYLVGIPVVFTGKDLRPYTTTPVLEIPIGESDIELFNSVILNNTTVKWSFETNDHNLINIIFMTKDEYNQRRV